MKRPTQANARLAGVCSASVPQVVNNRTGNRVSIAEVTSHPILPTVVDQGYVSDACVQARCATLATTCGPTGSTLHVPCQNIEAILNQQYQLRDHLLIRLQ